LNSPTERLSEAQGTRSIFQSDTADPVYFIPSPVRRRQILVLLCSVVSLTVALLIFHTRLHGYVTLVGSLVATLKTVYKELVPLTLREGIYSFRANFLLIFANPYYYLGVAVVFALEWLFPARKTQRILSVGFVQDLLYYAFTSLVLVYATVPFIRFLDGLYAKHLNFLTVQAVAAWPLAIRALFGFLLNDLVHWTHHFLRHRIKPLWHFHAVHHSQREMNLFADTRSHFVDIFFAISVLFIPLNMFNVSFAVHGWIYFVPVLYFRLYHANIKTNLGPLKHILVTPQSHRIHHSLERKHWDKNYGFVFTVWDRVFGTQYKNYDEYPDTGINDEDFPLAGSFTNVLKTFFAQLLYPFRQLVQRIFIASRG
jgi:sterol desaturase/sphingolipid hydroxylase (fatty acid hydroxylase superfamily)